MSKLDISTVLAVMQSNQTPPQLLHRIEKELKEVAAEEEDDKPDPGPTRAYEPLLLMTGDALTADSPFFVLDYDTASMNFTEAIEAFKKAIWEHNNDLTGKKKTKFITTIGSAFALLSGARLKPLGLKLRYRQPVIMVSEPNQLPEQDVS